MRSACATTPARMAMALARTHKQRGPAPVRSAARPAQAQPDAHADRGAALIRDAGRLGARPQAAFRQSPGLAMNFSTDVIQEVTELNMEVHGADGLHDGSARRQARARRHHLEPPRRRYRAADEGGAAAGAVAPRSAPHLMESSVTPSSLDHTASNRMIASASACARGTIEIHLEIFLRRVQPAADRADGADGGGADARRKA